VRCGELSCLINPFHSSQRYARTSVVLINRTLFRPKPLFFGCRLLFSPPGILLHVSPASVAHEGLGVTNRECVTIAPASTREVASGGAVSQLKQAALRVIVGLFALGRDTHRKFSASLFFDRTTSYSHFLPSPPFPLAYCAVDNTTAAYFQSSARLVDRRASLFTPVCFHDSCTKV